MELCSLCGQMQADEIGLLIHLAQQHKAEWHEMWNYFEGPDGR
jgi:hypothetical protein